jgi:hypothetical protein
MLGGLLSSVRANLIANNVTPRSNQGWRSFLQPQIRSFSNERDDGSSPLRFIEFNGMKKSAKFTSNIAEYLQQRKGWVGMIIEDRNAKTIRFDHIVKYISQGNLN